MSEQGDNIAFMVKQVRTLYKEVARLLETADGMMKEQGWQLLRNDRQCVHVGTTPDGSYSWPPNYVYHFYTSKDPRYAKVVGVISVVLADEEGRIDLDEPIATAGFLEVAEGTKELRSKHLKDYVDIHLYMPDYENTGRFLEAVQTEAWPDYDGPAVRVGTMGLPLTEIADADALRDKIVKPLLHKIEEALA